MPFRRIRHPVWCRCGFPIPLYAAAWEVDSGKNKIGAMELLQEIAAVRHTDQNQKISSDNNSEKL